MIVRVIVFDQPEVGDDICRTAYVQEYKLLYVDPVYFGGRIGAKWSWVITETKEYEMLGLNEIKKELKELYPKAEFIEVSLFSGWLYWLRPLQTLWWRQGWI